MCESNDKLIFIDKIRNKYEALRSLDPYEVRDSWLFSSESAREDGNYLEGEVTIRKIKFRNKYLVRLTIRTRMWTKFESTRKSPLTILFPVMC